MSPACSTITADESESHCRVDVYLCLGISLLLEQYPGVGVEEGGVLGFGLDGLVAHLLGLGEITSRLADVVGVVVEATEVVGFPLQTGVVGGECLLHFSLLVEQVAHDAVEVGDDVGRALFVDDADAVLEGVESLVGLVLLG